MRPLLRLTGLPAGFAVLGAVCGVVWHAVWEAPLGIVYKGEWYLQPSGPDLAFDGTGTWTLVGVGAGLLAGVVVAALLHGSELLTLLGVVLGSAVAAWTMFLVGHTLGPPDPHALAAGMEDYQPLPAQLDLGEDVRAAPFGTPAVLALPLGALLGFAVVTLSADGRRPRRAVASVATADAG